MICPGCGTNMEKTRIDGVAIDTCPACHGMLCPTNSIGLHLRLLIESGHDYKPKTTPLKVENVAGGEQGWICNAPSQTEARSISATGETGAFPHAERSKEYLQSDSTGAGNEMMPNSWSELDPPVSAPSATPAAKTHNCPVCGQAMIEMRYAPDSDVTLTECKNCRLVWMDDGTICHMIDYLSIPPAANTNANTFNKTGTVSRNTLSRTDELNAASGANSRNPKPAYEHTIEIPIIRRILGIPCVERDLSIMPWATIGIIAVNVVLFLIVIASPNDMGTLFRTLGFIPARLAHEPAGAAFSFFTSMFMHSGWSHLFSNMVFLWLFGGRIEEDYGTKTFVAVYVIAGIIAGLTHALTNLGSPIPAVGASGAISGVLGAFFILHPKNRVVTYFMLIPIPMSAALFLGFWFSMQIINSLLASAAGGAGIAWFAHIGGFIAGMAMAYPLKKQVELIEQEQLKIAA
jgi:membrane associated rhomboid family serine protease